MVDVLFLRVLLAALVGWLDRHQQEVFVIDLASRRVHIVGSTPYPDAVFMQPSQPHTHRGGRGDLGRAIAC